MKKLLIFIYLISPNFIFGQFIESNMAAIKKDFENGILARNMNLQFVNSISKSVLDKKYKKHEPLVPWDVITVNFLRFSEFEYDRQTQAYVGKVFLSNRYVNWDFKKKYVACDSFKNDKNGYFMMCKLYKVKSSFRLNIYPELLTNIYKKNFCSANERKALGIDKAKVTNKKGYFDLLKKIVLIEDKVAGDFIAKPQTNLKSNGLDENIKRKINFKKQIKIFKVLVDAKEQVIGLEMAFNKYSYSDDLLETSYKYDYRSYDDSTMHTKNVAATAFLNSWSIQDRVSDKTKPAIVIKSDSVMKYVPFNRENNPIKEVIKIRQIITIGWILGGDLEIETNDVFNKSIEENIENIMMGDTIHIKENTEIFDMIPQKGNDAKVSLTHESEKWKILEKQEIMNGNKKKQIWIKVKSDL